MKPSNFGLTAFAAACLIATSALSAQIMVPAGFTVESTSSTGASFVHTGVVTSGDTLSITVTGPVYLEAGPAYGTNAAGVVLVAGVDGDQPVGSALACTTVDSIEVDCGSLIVSITSAGKIYYGRLFLATRKDGFGRRKPPEALTYTGSLKKLFGKDSNYKKFKFTNPTFTFLISDTLYSDNTGAFAVKNN